MEIFYAIIRDADGDAPPSEYAISGCYPKSRILRHLNSCLIYVLE